MTPDSLAIALSASLGAQVMVMVGDEAALTQRDPAVTEGVRMAQSAVEIEVEGPVGSAAEVRVEEGVFHAGGLEAAEATVSIGKPWIQAWVGRSDLPVTLDRALEPEQMAITLRPALSSAVLPLHATGAGLNLALPERATLHTGASYATSTSDAPYLWARMAVHPLGQGPEVDGEKVDGFRFELSGARLQFDSEALGSFYLNTADTTLWWGPAMLRMGWLQTATNDVNAQSLLAEVGSRLFELGPGHFRAQGRMEQVQGLIEGEDRRWLSIAHIDWTTSDGAFSAYVEAAVLRETGSSVAANEDVVTLDSSIERANDLVSVGLLMRM